MRVLTFGTYDLLHVGHVRLLERARALGDTLIVGVSSDAFSESKKGRRPVYDEAARMEIIRSLRCVDDVFLEESMEAKPDYLRHWRADLLVMGDDWEGEFDDMVPGCKTIYLPRTPEISSTGVEEDIKTR